MDGDRSPTLTVEERTAVDELRDAVDNVQVVQVYSVDLIRVLDALDRLTRRDDLMRKQLKAEQAKARRKR